MENKLTLRDAIQNSINYYYGKSNEFMELAEKEQGTRKDEYFSLSKLYEGKAKGFEEALEYINAYLII